jgi:hypothetical protein
MAGKEEVSSTVIYVLGLSGTTRMNFEIKVSLPCGVVVA